MQEGPRGGNAYVLDRRELEILLLQRGLEPVQGLGVPLDDLRGESRLGIDRRPEALLFIIRVKVLVGR